MRFALLGDHPDGLAMARALAATGRHVISVYSGPPAGAEALQAAGSAATRVGDIEEVLADPNVQGVIVAGPPGSRPALLRRALQSERPVLCVHPADHSPDIAYEAGMIQADTRQLLVPLITETFHPGIIGLAELVRGERLGALRLVEVEWRSTGEVLIDIGVPGHPPSLPGWGMLRLLGGEVAEVFAQVAGDELEAGRPVLVSGRFDREGLFQVNLLPSQVEASLRIKVQGARGQAELVFSEGWPGPARLIVCGEPGGSWPAWDPWPELAAILNKLIEQGGRLSAATMKRLWQEEVRWLELDDGARRSAKHRRASLLDYQDASEEVTFKGTMALAGCAMLWSILVLAILSAWVPRLGRLILPLLVVFLVLQLLRYLIPRKEVDSPEKANGPRDA